jgi:hypothetical protein
MLQSEVYLNPTLLQCLKSLVEFHGKEKRKKKKKKKKIMLQCDISNE